MCHGHVFEIYTIVADIDDGIDLIFGFKNMVETEGMLNTRTGEFDFLGRSIPIFPRHDLGVKPGGKAYPKVRIPFAEKLSLCQTKKENCAWYPGLEICGIFQGRLPENGNHGCAGNNFQMHHYQQIAKSKPEAEHGLSFKMSCDRGPLRNISSKSENPNQEPREDPYPWLVDDDPRRFQ